MSELKLNINDAMEFADVIEAGKVSLNKRNLKNRDDATTLTANKKGQESFDDADYDSNRKSAFFMYEGEYTSVR